ncbi:MAG TPA: hypothetical protein VN517_03925 [Terriglobales bacterium]|nr:hypothetical protein [Terriglobales bacterium]
MTKILLMFAALTFSTPAWATWSMVNANTCNLSCSGTTCAVSVTSTTAGNVIAALYVGNTNSSITNVTGGAFTHCAGCQGGSSGTDWIDMGGTLSATGGTTTVTVTVSPSASSWTACATEWHSTLGAGVVDTQATHTDTSCTTCAAPALTITGTNDLIIQAAGCTNTCATSATAGFVGASPYTNPAQAPGGAGWGAALNQASYVAPNWSQNTSGAVQVSAWAIKETGAAPVSVRGKMILQ